jgi:hypothetical protein
VKHYQKNITRPKSRTRVNARNSNLFISQQASATHSREARAIAFEAALAVIG